eukprot:7553078-Pyramimonas_sp.AAC.1
MHVTQKDTGMQEKASYFELLLLLHRGPMDTPTILVATQCGGGGGCSSNHRAALQASHAPPRVQDSSGPDVFGSFV